MAYAPMGTRRLEGETPYDLVLDLGHGEDFEDPSMVLRGEDPLTQVDEDGLPIPEEAERLNLVETASEKPSRLDGMYVGRRTGAGARDLLLHVDAKPRGLEDRLRMTVVQISPTPRPDPKWEGYESLLPEPESGEMEDRQLLQELLEDGVEADEPSIVHRVATTSKKGAVALPGLFEKLGLQECSIVKEEGALVVSGVQICELPDEIHKVAWILESRSPKARGEYRSWSLDI